VFSRTLTGESKGPLADGRFFEGFGGLPPMKLSARVVSVTGSDRLSVRQIRWAVVKRFKEVIHFYEKALFSKLTINGDIHTVLLIMPTGRVQSCSVAKALPHKKLGQWICDRANQWSFPPFKSGLTKVEILWRGHAEPPANMGPFGKRGK
ncbi:hypothetical protein KJ865_05285, partial [Myxococcota bacterium]|nr:hypothetical protein [Myxococcota bacterium]